MRTRAFIVEDEPLARRTLRDLVDETEWLELVGEATDGYQAIQSIDTLEPDLVFLDVQMPEANGIEVLEAITHRPAVVFTTAFDRYAVAAFEHEAIDYLVKPFGSKRFAAALRRVRERLEDRGAEASAARAEVEKRALAALTGEPLQRLFARKGANIVPIPVDTVTHIEGADDYSCVHARGESFLIPVRLSQLESRLDPSFFVRVHRSRLVNLDQITKMSAPDGRRLLIRLNDGSEVWASRAGTVRLRKLML